MKRYSIALYPSDPNFAISCVGIAQRSFGGAADGYLLDGQEAQPHITLCQFETTTSGKLKTLWDSVRIAHAPIFLIRFDMMYFKQGENRDKNHIWAGLATKRDKLLLEVQRNVVSLIAEHGEIPLTATGAGYFPHLTLARLKKPAAGKPLIFWDMHWPDEGLRQWPVCFDLTLGLMGENEVYREKLFPGP